MLKSTLTLNMEQKLAFVVEILTAVLQKAIG